MGEGREGVMLSCLLYENLLSDCGIITNVGDKQNRISGCDVT
jgi:hypothetical protein